MAYQRRWSASGLGRWSGRPAVEEVSEEAAWGGGRRHRLLGEAGRQRWRLGKDDGGVLGRGGQRLGDNDGGGGGR
uniref:Uncharacterized protein n=1 Tax=Oryza sativa subsp. japonica TaxID=39947 RepID=Q6H4K8_ORYSJ|nr:hypothetical protein [Oryza sativa Japonica Group]